MKYIEYYNKYLNYLLSNKNQIVESKYLDSPVNKSFYYPFIFTQIDNYKILSISSCYYTEFLKYIKERELDDNIILKIEEYLNEKNILHSTRKMFRMTFNDPCTVNDDTIIFSEEYQKCVIQENDKIVAYAKISDVICGGANIVIYTEKEYRNKGYATELLKYITNYILEKGLIPIYFVDENNVSSIACAKKVGYHIENKESVVTIENK